MWKLMLLAGLGGFFGTCSRFLINRLFLLFWKSTFPMATFAVNVVGCFVFGILFGMLGKSGIVSPKLNALLITGFCGGFTTFSTFSFDAFSLGSNGMPLSSAFYAVASVLTGLLAVWLGLWMTR